MNGRRRFVRQRLIRFSDCDPAAIVFFPQYFVMFNGLVEDWFDDAEAGLGLGYHRLVVERRIGLPTVHLEADFRAVSRMGERVSLGLAVARVGSRSIALDLGCEGADGEVRVTLRQVLVTTSLDTHRALALPEDLAAALRPWTPEPPAAAPASTPTIPN